MALSIPPPLRLLSRLQSIHKPDDNTNQYLRNTVLGKVEEDPVWWSFNEHYLPWHGHVTALTVAPQARRLGLAQSLTKALERGCEEQDAWFVDLFVREGNTTAVGLYEGLGYDSFVSLLSLLPFELSPLHWLDHEQGN